MILSKYKIIAILALTAAILGGLYNYDKWRTSSAFDAGYQKAQLEYSQDALETLTGDLGEINKKLDATTARQANELRTLERLTETLSADRERSEGIYREISKVVQKGDGCKRVGSDVIGLFNTILEHPTSRGDTGSQGDKGEDSGG